MVRDHAEGNLAVSRVRLPGDCLNAQDDRPEQVAAKHVRLIYRRREHSLQAAAEVNVSLRERGKRTVFLLLELHEDGIADLEEAPTVAIGVAVPAERGIVLHPGELVEEFRVRAAGLQGGIFSGGPNRDHQFFDDGYAKIRPPDIPFCQDSSTTLIGSPSPARMSSQIAIASSSRGSAPSPAKTEM